MPTTRSATNLSTLNSALAASANGDTITLAAGVYGNFSSNRVFTSKVTIKSTSPLTPAIFTDISLSNAKFFALEDLKIAAPYLAAANSGACPFTLSFCDDITISRCEIVGQNTAAGLGTGRGLLILGCNRITVEDCEVHRFLNGLVATVARGVTMQRNHIYDLGSDGIDFYQCIGGLWDGNFIHDFNAGGEDHSDAGQWATNLTELKTANLIIRNNIIDIGTGSYMQMLFSNNEARGAGGDDSFRYQGIVIENNYIAGYMYHGITVGDSGSVTIRNNTLVWKPWNASHPYNYAQAQIAPGQPGYADFGATSAFPIPKLTVVDANAPCIITGNRWYGAPFSSAPRMNLQASEASLVAAGWSISDNLIYKDNPGPTRPTFVTYFGGGAPALPTLADGATFRGTAP